MQTEMLNLLIYTEEKQHLLFTAEIIDYTAKKHCVLIPEHHIQSGTRSKPAGLGFST